MVLLCWTKCSQRKVPTITEEFPKIAMGLNSYEYRIARAVPDSKKVGQKACSIISHTQFFSCLRTALARQVEATDE